MKILIILCLNISLILIGCTKNNQESQQSTTTTVTQAPQTETTLEKKGLCPAGIGASQGDQPKLEMSFDNGIQLILCGYSTESEYDIYSVTSNQVSSEPLVRYGALDHVKATVEGKLLSLEEQLYVNKEFVPGFKTSLDCSSGKCIRSNETCVFQKPEIKNKNLVQIKSYITGKNSGKSPDESLIQEAADLAYSGNKEAQQLFLKKNPKLKLDGAAAELFESSKATVFRLISAKCL